MTSNNPTGIKPAISGSFYTDEVGLYELAESPWQVLATPQDKTFGFCSDYLVTPGITINRERYAARCHLQGLSPADRLIFLVFPRRSTGMSFWNTPLHQQGIIVMMPGGFDALVSAGEEFLEVHVNLALLHKFLPEEKIAILMACCANNHLLKTSDSDRLHLAGWLQSLLQKGLQHPEFFSSPAAQHQYEQDIVLSFGEFIRVNKKDAPIARSHIRQQGLKRALEYLRSSPANKISLAGLKKQAMISERSLQYAFKESIGITPYKYLRLRRLRAAYRFLILSTKQTTTITDTAINNGFYDIGRFASDYQSCFGELPSHTLLRPVRAVKEGLFHRNLDFPLRQNK